MKASFETDTACQSVIDKIVECNDDGEIFNFWLELLNHVSDEQYFWKYVKENKPDSVIFDVKTNKIN